jgi:multidrug resistance efflux pump
VFSTREASVGAEAEHDRLVVNDDLAVWKAELAGLDAGSEEALDDVLRHSIAHVEVAQTYANALVAALANAVQTNSFNATSLVTANANAGVLRDTLAGLLTPLESSAQKIDADKLAEKSAKDALAQAQAGATDEDINAAQAAVAGAQAALDAANVALNDARVVAPFAGTVASVNVKSGDWVTSGATAVSLVPAQALQVTAYFSQADAAELAVGDDAVVTLDAYGNSRPFAARVASIDSSPTMRDNTSAYKVVLEFDHADPAIWAGMSASVTITK